MGEDGNVRERSKKCYTNIGDYINVEKHKSQIVFIFIDSINFEPIRFSKGTIKKKKNSGRTGKRC